MLAPLLVRGAASAGRMNAQEVANSLWAVAKLGGARGTGLDAVLLGRVQELAAQLEPQHVSNVLWAMATQGAAPPPKLRLALEAQATRLAPRMNAQAVANVLWAYGTLGLPVPPRLLEALTQRTVRVAPHMTGQGVATVLWALATLDVESHTLPPALLPAVEARLGATAARLKPQEVASALWAAARLGVRPLGRVLERLDARLLDAVRPGRPAPPKQPPPGASASALAAALVNSTLEGIRAPPHHGGVSVLKPGELAMVMWAYATLAVFPTARAPRAFGVLTARALELVPQLAPDEVAVLLWSSAVSGTLADRSGLGPALLGRLDDVPTAGWSSIARMQLHQVFVSTDQLPLATAEEDALQRTLFRHRDFVDACAADFRGLSERLVVEQCAPSPSPRQRLANSPSAPQGGNGVPG